MTFLGDVKFVEDRAPSETTALVLRRCLDCGQQAAGAAIATFLEQRSIKPSAFFADIDGSWTDKPFIGQHVFKVVTAAGYGGTENDLWLAVTDQTAPYKIAKPKPEAKPKAFRRVTKAQWAAARKMAKTKKKAV